MHKTTDRIVTDINRNWWFRNGFSPEFTKTDCNLDGFERIAVPHTVQKTPYSGFDEKMYQGVYTYRRVLKIPEAQFGKRVFVDFEGAMTASTVFINGVELGEYCGGYTPFSFELTPYLDLTGANVLTVRLDTTERPDIPPFGNVVDYLCYGGIYRNVQLRFVHQSFIKRLFVKPRAVLSESPFLDVGIQVENSQGCEVEAQLLTLDGDMISSVRGKVGDSAVLTIDSVKLDLWEIDRPALYQVRAVLKKDGQDVDSLTTRFGFRECEFTPDGFRLNGRKIKIRGLNRHQSFPFVGYAMPARVQRRDADILKNELHVNFVRSSHYPPSPAFLDRCDEIGLLVFEEIPGWQFIGDKAWQERSCRYVREMIERDFNHPSVILWGVRINESPDSDEFYRETNAIAHALDDTRQTGGVRGDGHLNSTFLEDVFTHNDFSPETLREPNHERYLLTEFCGHMYPIKHFDNIERISEHIRRHAHIHSAVGTHPGIAGAVAWCAFDYNTHGDFGSGDRICHHGICDMFRLPKYTAGLYRSQCSPGTEVVLEAGFNWNIGDRPTGGGVGHAFIFSNCETLKLYLGDEFVTELLPRRDVFPGLVHPPFQLNDKFNYIWGHVWKALKIEGFVGGRKVAERILCGTGVDSRLIIRADDSELLADEQDATRISFLVTDQQGNRQNFATAALSISVDGPAELIGDNPFSLVGGGGAVWIRSTGSAGKVHVKISHPWIGIEEVNIQVNNAPDEMV